eukprot:TRINITY_DN8483_c0_g1_i1.p2 TRINITY_DN8483_c0_g1~~TRINITY_DN8483_c0_g1_i1.p2  ORF type:complete len:283 (+),score=49.69 TRINITY_DN8483_c0_g1_i1:1480-2328(+)
MESNDRPSMSEGMASAAKEGVAGAKAMMVDVVALMWLRTVMNHQYRHGNGMLPTIAALYREGGLARFYSGFTAAMVEAPLSRGVGAAANYATLHLMAEHGGDDLPLFVKTAASSVFVGSFRLVYYPLDTLKTMLQVEGKQAIPSLRSKIKTSGLSVLYHGAASNILATAVRHTVWFTTYNYLDAALAPRDTQLATMMQNAMIGGICAITTDVLGNPLSVIKAYRQTSTSAISYGDIIKTVIKKHGWHGLFTRGLATRIWVDVLNSALFTVVWRWLLADQTSE